MLFVFLVLIRRPKQPIYLLNKFDNTLKIPKVRTGILTLSNSTKNFTKMAEMSVSEDKPFVLQKNRGQNIPSRGKDNFIPSLMNKVIKNCNW